MNAAEIISTPRRDLAPAIEEESEEPESESQSKAAPLRQIENNISALLRGDIPIARVPGIKPFRQHDFQFYNDFLFKCKFSLLKYLDIQPPRRPVGFRAGVHKSESAKEMLLSQHVFGALPPSPPSSADVSTNELILYS